MATNPIKTSTPTDANTVWSSNAEDEAQLIYANLKQQTFLESWAKRKTFVAGRGVGKSFVLGFSVGEASLWLPRGKALLAGISFEHIKSKTLPGVLKALGAQGFHEYNPETKLGHYVKWQKPPRHFDTPIEAPQSYKYVISFVNGFCLELMSLDNPDTGRGGNYDCLFIDESALIDEETFDRVLFPMVRSNSWLFPNNKYHQLIADFTSMPWLASGQWVLKTEELMKQYGSGEYLYLEASALDNLKVLGQPYIDRIRKKMHPLAFAVEILNQRLKKVPQTFYPSFNDRRHVVWNSYEYDFDSADTETRNVSVRPDLLLEATFDFNAGIGTMLIAQDYGTKIRWVDEIYTVDEGIGVDTEESTNVATTLSRMFREKYYSREDKTIYLYGDRGGFSRSAGNNLSLYAEVEKDLRAHGWQVHNKVMKSYPNQRLKHILIDKIFAGKKGYPEVEIDGNACKYLIISIQNSGMKADFTKDKGAERSAVDQRTTTHASDAMDYLLYPKYLHLESDWQDLTDITFIGLGR